MKRIFTILLLMFASPVFAQNDIDWDGKYRLQLSDFQSAATQIGNVNIVSLNSAVLFDFVYQMSQAEFMFTKNFNNKVSCRFKRDAATVVAPDTATALELLNFSRYAFDLAELYARKFRKKIYLNKGLSSNPSFLQPFYDEFYNTYSVRHANASKETAMGSNAARLAALHNEVLEEIAQLSDFCKDCKPSKKR